MPKGSASRKYTKGMANAICEALANGQSLRSAAKAQGVSDTAVKKWTKEKEDFGLQYALARMAGYERLGDELVDIADNGSNDWMEINDPDNPGYRLNGEHYQRSRIRIDTRKWMLARMLPKLYGDRTSLDVRHSGTITHKVETSQQIDQELEKMRLRRLEGLKVIESK